MTTTPRVKLDPTPCPPALTVTAAAICGGPNRTTPGELFPAPTLAFVVLLQKQKHQRRSKIRRTQKVICPDNGSFLDEVTLSSGRTTRGKEMKTKRNYRVLPYPAERPEMGRISLRCGGCGGAPSNSGPPNPLSAYSQWT
ncbi:hypothetical protein MTP99_007502 [Tenebrio molitor]|nr:hypothetical protein MTP99_007502 [Tenebrio molitor]